MKWCSLRKINSGMIVLGMFFVLYGVTVAIGYRLYKEQDEHLNSLERQGYDNGIKINSTRETLNGLMTDLDSLKSVLDNVYVQYNMVSKNMLLMENRLAAGEDDRRTILTQIETMNKSIDEWQTVYSDTMNNFKEKAEMLSRNGYGISAPKNVTLSAIKIEKSK